MGFEKRTFSDGDIEYDIPKWRKIIEELSLAEEHHDFIGEIKRDSKNKSKDVMLKNRLSNSYINVKENGDIDMFSEFGTGIRMTGKTIQIHGDIIQLIGNEVQTISSANGNTSNGYVLNNNGVQDFPRRKGKTKTAKEMIREAGN